MLRNLQPVIVEKTMAGFFILNFLVWEEPLLWQEKKSIQRPYLQNV